MNEKHSVLVVGANYAEFQETMQWMYRDSRVLHWGSSDIKATGTLPLTVSDVIWNKAELGSGKVGILGNQIRIAGARIKRKFEVFNATALQGAMSQILGAVSPHEISSPPPIPPPAPPKPPEEVILNKEEEEEIETEVQEEDPPQNPAGGEIQKYGK